MQALPPAQRELVAKGTPLMEKGYKGVFESLSKRKQAELIGRKVDFTEKAGRDM